MKGYVLAEVDVTDPALFEEYRPLAAAAIAAHGGRYLIRGGKVTALEGAAPDRRTVLAEFASPAAALAWYHSPEYRKAKAIRERAATTTMRLIEGAG